MPTDPPRPSRGAPPISVDEPPPSPKPGRDPQDDEVGYLVLVLWNAAGTSIRTETHESPPLKRRYLPWVNELFRRIAKDQVDRIPAEKIEASLERSARLPAPRSEDPKPR